MLVSFKRDWFAPGGLRVRASNGRPVEVDEGLLSALPKDAKVLGDQKGVAAPEPKVEEPKTLASVDEERKSLDELQAKLEAAEREADEKPKRGKRG